MKTFTKDELKEILDKHLKWLRGENGGERADLSFCDLANCNLKNVILNRASLDGASLSRASLDGASLDGASLDGASLDGASLNCASLNGASLNCASLNGASLNWASLNGASLVGAKNVPFIPISCPDTGAFIAWKKVNGYIIKLQIPEDARRCSATTTKCRCDKALVLAIEKFDGTVADVDSVVNYSYAATTYKVGEMVYPDSFDDDRWRECSHGIHFFITRQEAVDW